MALYRRNKTWWVYFTDEVGRPVRKSTRTSDKKLARTLHDQMEVKLRLNPESVRRKQSTLKYAIDLWLAHATYKATHERDRRVLKFFNDQLGHMRLADIKARHVQEALSHRPHLKPASVNVYISIIKAVLRRSERVWELIERAPHLELVHNPQRRVRYITPLEAKKLLNELPEHQRDVVAFSLLTGLRKSNVLGLCWDQVDLERATAWIHPDQSKSRRAIRVPLNRQAVELLERRATFASKGFGRVFTYKGRAIEQINTKAFRAALARAGIKDFRWHDLRHTWASWHIQAGTPLYVLQELGGWHTPTMVQRYAHLSSERLALFVENSALSH